MKYVFTRVSQTILLRHTFFSITVVILTISNKGPAAARCSDTCGPCAKITIRGNDVESSGQWRSRLSVVGLVACLLCFWRIKGACSSRHQMRLVLAKSKFILTPNDLLLLSRLCFPFPRSNIPLALWTLVLIFIHHSRFSSTTLLFRATFIFPISELAFDHHNRFTHCFPYISKSQQDISPDTFPIMPNPRYDWKSVEQFIAAGIYQGKTDTQMHADLRGRNLPRDLYGEKYSTEFVTMISSADLF